MTPKTNHIKLYKYICKQTKTTPKRNLSRFSKTILLKMINDLLSDFDCLEFDFMELKNNLEV